MRRGRRERERERERERQRDDDLWLCHLCSIPPCPPHYLGEVAPKQLIGGNVSFNQPTILNQPVISIRHSIRLRRALPRFEDW